MNVVSNIVEAGSVVYRMLLLGAKGFHTIWIAAVGSDLDRRRQVSLTLAWTSEVLLGLAWTRQVPDDPTWIARVLHASIGIGEVPHSPLGSALTYEVLNSLA